MQPRSQLVAFLAVTALAGGVPFTAGCSSAAAVGQSCDTGAPGAPNTLTITHPALECEGRICLQVGTGAALCSAECAGDEDCSRVHAPGSALCPHGFTCAQMPATAGDLGCQRVCACQDAVAEMPSSTADCPAGAN
jgi:hypothetical protein